MSRRRACLAAGSLLLLALAPPTLAGPRVVRWKHLSTKTGDLQPPNAGDHAVEMEGAAVAQVCYQHGVPFLVVRGLSDRAGSDARTEARRHLEVAARNAARAALAVGRRLASEGP